MGKFPDWRTLAHAELLEIQLAIKPIGLQVQRSKRLKELALEMQKRNYVLPHDRIELESIPFLGQYIANAVELFIFHKTKPLLDVNMARVLERYFGPRKKADLRYDPYLQDLAKRIVNHPHAKEINWAVLDFAALICKARVPSHCECPLRKECLYFNNMEIVVT
ncbi:hypothetical protein OI18_22295 [Flavihumibacter solisilvae]|uniref:HhH-GPD domain-containing protein n=1 Tax=Flavihumibacter solisilvae TaxID=1349421 RepID=A0A0C1L6R4_9BACT|nr:hypothetical protein OI18_22295 [Flavihumibacter solisilvae]